MDIWTLIAGMLALPLIGLLSAFTAALFVRAWNAWEGLLRRFRVAEVPDWRNADLAAIVAESGVRVRRVSYPGGFVLIIPEHEPGEDFRERLKATAARIRQEDA